MISWLYSNFSYYEKYVCNLLKVGKSKENILEFLVLLVF